jgi:hypothetical protein
MALALIGAAGTRVDLPVTLSAITTALGVISLVILVIYLISPPSYPVGPLAVSLGRKIGIWLGLITTAGVAIGGYMAMQEEGAAVGDRTQRYEPRGTGGAPPPPPPTTGP